MQRMIDVYGGKSRFTIEIFHVFAWMILESLKVNLDLFIVI